MSIVPNEAEHGRETSTRRSQAHRARQKEAAPLMQSLTEGGIRKLMLAGELKAPPRLTSADLLPLIEERLWYVLQAMGQDFIALASARDLTSMFNALIEKRNLLKGEPTSIVRSETRGDLRNALGLFLAEAQRRGLMLDENTQNITPRTDEVRSPIAPAINND